MKTNIAYHADCEIKLKEFEENSIDTCITDPPYGISFMGKAWDYDIPSVDVFKEILRVLKPGAFLLCFGGTRTFHRMAVNIEDAGFEIRDTLMYLYGSGFPKSYNISKGIDNSKGLQREIIGTQKTNVGMKGNNFNNNSETGEVEITKPACQESKEWEGYGTALKPAFEPIIMAMKPVDKNFVSNALKHGVAGLNIDASRVGTEEREYKGAGKSPNKINNHSVGDTGIGMLGGTGKDLIFNVKGRHPANIIHDGSEEVVKEFPDSISLGGSGSVGAFREGKIFGKGGDKSLLKGLGYNDSGSASRFFYCAKVSSSERGDLTHPTMKPIALIEYLVRLTKTPKGGIVLDPFAGTGTTGLACKIVGREYILIEKKEEYYTMLLNRLKNQKIQRKLF